MRSKIKATKTRSVQLCERSTQTSGLERSTMTVKSTGRLSWAEAKQDEANGAASDFKNTLPFSDSHSNQGLEPIVKLSSTHFPRWSSLVLLRASCMLPGWLTSSWCRDTRRCSCQREICQWELGNWFFPGNTIQRKPKHPVRSVKCLLVKFMILPHWTTFCSLENTKAFS